MCGGREEEILVCIMYYITLNKMVPVNKNDSIQRVRLGHLLQLKNINITQSKKKFFQQK